MLAPTTFPSRVKGANLPKSQIGEAKASSGEEYLFAKSEAKPFHTEGMMEAKQRVMDRARINVKNKANYNIGGWRNKLPKPQPAGSFIRPFGSSGNDVQASDRMQGRMRGQLSGSGGAFRTPSGASQGKQKLLERGQQLEQLSLLQQEMAEGLVPIAPTPAPPVELTKGETEAVTITLLISDLVANFQEGEYQDITEENLRKIIQLLRTEGVNLELNELQSFQDQLGGILDTIRDLRGSRGEERQNIDALSRSKQSNIVRIQTLVKDLLGSYNLRLADRKLRLKTITRELQQEAAKKGEKIEKEEVPSAEARDLERLSRAELQQQAKRLVREGAEVPRGGLSKMKKSGLIDQIIQNQLMVEGEMAEVD